MDDLLNEVHFSDNVTLLWGYMPLRRASKRLLSAFLPSGVLSDPGPYFVQKPRLYGGARGYHLSKFLTNFFQNCFINFHSLMPFLREIT